MKFLIDAQLPYRLKDWLTANNFDAVHTTDLPQQNLTSDLFIADFADDGNLIVITKDSDFLKLRILRDKPKKLLIVTTGNIVNEDLLILFEQNFSTITKLFESFDIVEMSNEIVVGQSFD